MKKTNNKIIAFIAAIALFIVAIVSGTYPTWRPVDANGTFTGTAKGMEGDVTMTITLEDGVITDVVGEGKNETPGLGTTAIEKVAKAMVEQNTTEVDTISGATVSSSAAIEAANAALQSAGLTVKDLKSKDAAATDESSSDKEADVVIVGAGGAGMTAAITAADAGKSVIIVESQPMAGGNSIRATGGMNAGHTKYQDELTWDEAGESEAVEATLAKANDFADNKTITNLAGKVQEQWDAYKAEPKGYFDSVELMELDTLIGGKGVNDPKLVETLAKESEDAIDWLNEQSKEADESNSGLTSVGQFGGASVKRIHRPLNSDGKTTAVGSYLIPILEKNAQTRDVEFLFDTTAKEIVMNDGKAAGIKAETKDGKELTVNAKSVILATGGFGANNDMVKKQNPALDGYITTNAAGAQGQGIEMATAKGIDAATVDMKQIQLHPTVHVDEKDNAHLITEGLRGDGAILVNKEGKRFTNEVGTRDAVSAAENEQTDGQAWLIIDQEMVDASAVIQGYINAGYTVSGETYEDLAKEMGADPAVFAQTMADWNSCVEKKEDTEFGRTSFVKQLAQGPYYALLVQPGVHHTMGGLKINEKTEVLNTKDEVIPGLFAAGEVTGGVHGANRLGGNAVADFVVFGRIAGNSASSYVGK